MKVVICDTETTIFEKGNPFARRNKLCYVGLTDADGHHLFDIEYSSSPYGRDLATIKEIIEEADLLVLFNAKFDLHWIRRYIPDILLPPCFDCQLAEFILSRQQWTLPSLDGCLEKYKLPLKVSGFREKYWDNGIDTPDIPRAELEEYLIGDLDGTLALYRTQLKEFADRDPKLFTLFNLQCVDLLCLEEMEFNGMSFDVEESERLAEETSEILNGLDEQLQSIIVIPGINWNSSDHISAILYGGTIKLPVREKTERILKDGTIKHGERWGVSRIDRPRLVEPIKGSETATEGIWSVGEPILKSLKPRGLAKKIIGCLLERAKSQKLFSTYYRGIPEIILEKDWEPGIIHGQFNQCVAATSRLSSSSPNLQNFANEIKCLFGSRYA